MNISAFRSALILIIFTISMTASAGEKFYVRADSVRIEHDNVRLKMSVWNCSESPVNTQLAYLPWGEHAIGLIAYAAGQMSGQAFSQVTYIEDFPGKDVLIPTNSSVTNEINLSRLFPKLSGYKYMKDVVIFWVYDKGLLDHSSSNYVGGMIQVLPTNQIFTSPSNPCK
ncbi:MULTISPECIES: hypothetical protein [unclassified Rhodanobacter]|uniref:hypothetical protein n=1 Tax=unclassified Rhodanobacter TaxID=2621553 RepID=UPI00160ACAE4|nr:MULTISPECIES: hypothetical protein [unclassified Rhodanobacter]MBB6242272.1 hypothetical protein [Rhodanobacter sp. MP1X3]MBB6245520.1 hypothetical protein [Rhodanobacter sp. A1T4]